MTLHGVVSSTDENVVKVTREAVKGLRPFSLEVGEVEFSSTYFQCIFARVKTNANLFNAHMALRHSFGMEEERVFMPHLSLVYGDFEMEKREKITKEIDIKNKFFEAKEITIIRADLPNPDTWEIVEQVKL
jgi:2'-5' RNA ligase